MAQTRGVTDAVGILGLETFILRRKLLPEVLENVGCLGVSYGTRLMDMLSRE